jgi:hypothetical protein
VQHFRVISEERHSFSLPSIYRANSYDISQKHGLFIFSSQIITSNPTAVVEIEVDTASTI